MYHGRQFAGPAALTWHCHQAERCAKTQVIWPHMAKNARNVIGTTCPSPKSSHQTPKASETAPEVPGKCRTSSQASRTREIAEMDSPTLRGSSIQLQKKTSFQNLLEVYENFAVNISFHMIRLSVNTFIHLNICKKSRKNWDNKNMCFTVSRSPWPLHTTRLIHFVTRTIHMEACSK